MAKVKNVTMTINSGNTKDAQKVTVSYNIEITSLSDLDKNYSIGIKLFGDDSEENEGSQKAQLLHNFIYLDKAGNSVLFKDIKLSLTGNSYSDSQIVKTKKLDEDPGVDEITVTIQPDINTPPIKTTIKRTRADEIYAAVTLFSDNGLGNKKIIHVAQSKVLSRVFA